TAPAIGYTVILQGSRKSLIFIVSSRPVIAAVVALLVAAQPLCACAGALANAPAEPVTSADCHGDDAVAAAQTDLHCSTIDCADCGSAAASEPAVPLTTKSGDLPEMPPLPAYAWPPTAATLPPARDGPPCLPALRAATPVTLFQVLRD
ncbi:MAG: hypothetical protein AAFX58_12070, partial [Pseudomonadota bacterium]